MDEQEAQATNPVDIVRLREFAAALSGHGVDTLEDLRLSICKDFNTGIETVTERTETSRALLVALLITEAKDDAARNGRRRLIHYWAGLTPFRSVFSLSKTEVRAILTKGRSHWRETRDPLTLLLTRSIARPARLLSNLRTKWLDPLLILLPLALVLLLIIRLNSSNSLQYVTTTAAVPAFHNITGKVNIQHSPTAKTAITNIADVLNRYTLADLPAGTSVQDKQLLSAELSQKMSFRKILSVPIKASNFSATLTPPDEATLILSPRTWDAKVTEASKFEVIVLRIEGSGETRSAVVALPGDKFDAAALLLSSHEAFLTGSVPSTTVVVSQQVVRN